MAVSWAMRLEAPGDVLRPAPFDPGEPGPGEVVIAVAACGVCRTDLHIVDGDLPPHHLPCVPGHEIVGRVLAAGARSPFSTGMRVGVPWLGWTCGICRFCRAGRENLCPDARFTGWQIDGGYATLARADARYCLPLPDTFGDVEAAPLLCAGLIGHRALRKAGDPATLALYGFGAAAHIVAQLALYEGRRVFAFTRPGDMASQAFARALGVHWAGGSGETPPEPFDAGIVFAPDGALVPAALARLAPGGRLVCAGIHMSDIPRFPYSLLWREREIVSVANLTRQDGLSFLNLAPKAGLRIHARPYPLAEANRAMDDLRHGRIDGAAVLVPGDGIMPQG